MSKVFTITEGLENLGALRTGGQGSVYKGRRIGEIYSAVKLIPTPIHTENQDDKNYRNFQNEVGKLSKVNENPSPNVVKMLSFGITESGSFPFIEMEYIDGPDLCELLQPPHDKIFALKELIKVAEHLASALAHCHRVGVKHGDIKSNNVKYNVHTGNYVLLDFGLAIMSDEQRRSSIRHAGAVEFMAPEQNDGRMLPQSDVYSYGIILYELLGGQVPFPLAGNSDTGRNTVMIAHMESELPDVIELRKANLPESWSEDQKAREMQIPGWLLELVDKCLQKDPANRFDDGISLLEALVSGSLSVIAKPAYSLVTDKAAEENNALRQQINELKNGINEKKPGILLSPIVFAFLIIAIVGLMGLVGYSEYKKREPSQVVINPVDSLVPEADTSEYDAEKMKRQREMIRRAAVKQALDSAIREEMRNSQKETTDSTEEPTPDTTATPQGF
ncbi:serine/threonine protein kinase [Pedobacter frigiditerrae]|uniref:Serine/threonine protein kinase n=1 Tax=Pedobacter frigiditerrae TaxID=2530452 RepID=A0A4R0MSV3_9SPHI|nr:serine/threonine-protein kinase [Pedobacter frigiditerrae]TCC90070.1 serine/threonine protein kinase [Pedobacter frigiditerrae]